MGIRSPYNSFPIFSLMKILVGVGISVVTLGFILFVNEEISAYYVSGYLLMIADGAIIVCMSVLTLFLFRGLENV